MTYRVKRPSRRSVRNALQGLSALAKGTTPEFEQPVVRRAPYKLKEADTNKALKEWRQRRSDVRLWRNNVGAFPLPNGGWLRYGLCTGSADFIGIRSIVVSPGMVGKRIAVFLAIESKAPGKDAEDHQDTWLTDVRDAGAIAGVARDAQEAEDLLTRWYAGMVGDER